MPFLVPGEGVLFTFHSMQSNHPAQTGHGIVLSGLSTWSETEWSVFGIALWHPPLTQSSQTSYDGFQYNKKFKRRGWTPTVPHHYFLSCVRRRRWLRLMVYLPSLTTSYSAGVNPAKNIPTSPRATPNETPILTPQPNVPGRLPTLPSFSIERNLEELKNIWRGDDRDWARCHGALRSLARDGRKLELWKHWIGPNGKPTTRRHVVCTGEPSKFLNGSDVAHVYELIADAPFEVDTTRAPVEFLRPVLDAHVGSSFSLGVTFLTTFGYSRLRTFYYYSCSQIRALTSWICSRTLDYWIVYPPRLV